MTENSLMKKMAVMCITFSVVAITIMGIYLAYREVPANAEALVAESGMNDITNQDMEMLQTDKGRSSGYLCIPLPQNYDSEQVEISNNYMKKRISILLKNIQDEFFYAHPLTGNSQHIKKLWYGYDNETARIDFLLDDVYEYNMIYEEGNLYLKFQAPKEVHKRIVVIDAGHGAEDTGTVAFGRVEAEVNLRIAEKIADQLQKTDIYCYLTRDEENENPDSQSRIGLANDIGADLFVSVHCNADAKTRVSHGIEAVYSDSYFIPGFDGKRLASLIEEHAVSATKSKKEKVEEFHGLELLDGAEVPAAVIYVGYLTNKQEADWLNDEAYLDQLSNGIAEGILESFKELEEGETDEP